MCRFFIFWYVKIILCTAHKIICADIDRVLLKWQKWLAIVFLASARMNNKQLSNVFPCMPSFFSIFIHGFMISWHFLYHFQVLLQIVLVKKVWNIVNIFAQLIILAGQMKIRTPGLIRLADRNRTVLKILFHADLFFLGLMFLIEVAWW